MSGIIKTLKTKTDDIEQNVYPKTVLEAVIDPETGKTLDIMLNNINQNINNDNITNEVSGSPILLTDSANGSLIDFKAYGRSTQVQYSGKNLLDCNSLAISTMNGITFTPVYDNSGLLLYINVNGTATNYAMLILTNNFTLPSGTYTLNGCPNGGSEGTYRLYTNSTYNLDIGEGVTFTLDSEHTFTNVVIYLAKGTVANNLKFYPMISTEGGEYEPYVGGVAAPNPDYPQAIKSVGDSGYFDGELLNGYYNSSTGEYVSQESGRICSKNPIPCKSGDIVKIVLENNVSYMYICYYGENGYISMLYGTENTNFIEKTIPNGATYFTFWAVNNGMTVDTVGHITVTINGKYALIVKSTGKNLWEKGDLSFTTYSDSLPKNLKAGTYTLSALVTSSGTDGTLSAIYFVNDEEEVAHIELQRGTRNSKTFTLNKDINIIRFYAEENYVASINDTATWSDIQLELGDKATPYEPCKETVTYIPLNEPLRSSLDGTVTDEASLDKITRRFTEVVFDGSEDEQWSTYGQEGRPDGTYCYFVFNTNKKLKYNTSTCTHFNYKPSAWSSGDVGTFSDHSINNFYFVTDKSTLSEWTAWLQANPITVQYELEEPITESIETDDIATYNSVTNISATDDANMWVKYYRNSNIGVELARIQESIDSETTTKAVVDSDTNKTLDVILDEMNDKIDNIEITGGGDASNKVSKTGDTMTGTLNIKTTVFPALSLTRSEGSTTAIEFINDSGVLGAIGMTNQGRELKRYDSNLSDSYTVLDSSNYKDYKHNSLSYFKSTSNVDVGIDDTTSNAIGYVKVNDQSDGCLYKQVFSDLWAHEIFGDYRTGQTSVRGKNNGVWQSWRLLLDTENYANYALPLTGGTVTGVVNFDNGIILPKGHLVTSFASGGGDNGYVKFAVFTCYSHATYTGALMSFRMTTRGATGIVHLNIFNSATAGQGFTGYISQTGNIPQCYMIQSSTGVFELYAAKSAWDYISITDFVFPQYQQDRMTVTWTDTFVSSLPSGVTVARPTNDWSGIVESTTSSISLSLRKGFNYIVFASCRNGMSFTETLVYLPWSGIFHTLDANYAGSVTSAISGTTYTVTFSGGASESTRLEYIEIGG